jgi:PKD repeat protein
MVTANFTVTPLTGDVYGTEFSVTNNSTGNIHTYIWNFGEGELIYETKNPKYIYKTNGSKNISLTSIDINGSTATYSTTVTAEYLYRDYLTFTQIPNTFADPGQPTSIPFKLQIISSQISKPMCVDLFAANSKSIPYDFISSRWSFLAPTWKFLDSNKKVTTTLPVLSSPIYNNENRIVAVSGEAEFYYVDSISNGDTGQGTPIVITATLQTSGFFNFNDSKIYEYPSFSNNETVKAGLLWQVNDLTPDLLRITSNYLDVIPKQKWADIKIPFIVSCHGNRSYRIPGAKDSTSEIIFSYPANNEIGKQQSVLISLSGIEFDNYTIDEAPLYFQATNDQEHHIGGYIFTTLTSHTTATNTAIVAQTTAFNTTVFNPNKFEYPAGYAPNPFVWISNPAHKTLNKITVIPYANNNTTVEYFLDKNILIDGFTKEVAVPALSTDSTYNYTMSGFAGIFGMAIDPRYYELICADAELDCLHKFTTDGTLLSTLQLSSIDGLNSINNAHTPSDVSLDRDCNIWVSLFNSISVLKFDKDFNLLFSAIPSGFNYDDVFDGDFVFKPPYIETDKENNCWATYSSPMSCFLVKYSSTGELLAQIDLEKHSVPADITINPQNNIWVAKSYNVVEDGGKIDLYDSTTLQVLSTVDNVFRPTHISLDRDNNLWFTFGDRKIGYLDTTSNTKYTWDVSKDDVDTNPFITETIITQEEREKDPTLTGLAVDVYNRVWVLDSLNNNVWLLSATPFFNEQRIRKFKARPNTPIGYYIDINNFSTYTLTSSQQALYANGDWTGNRWYQKYITFDNLYSTPISGISNTFNIDPFINKYQVSRLNNTFDMAGYLQSLALPENLNSDNIFFKDFLGAVVGNNQDSKYQDLGKTVYEKTANFTDYHGDIDTCGVQQLLSYAEQTKTPYIDYGTELPVEIKDYLDLASIPKAKLWGLQDEIPLLLQSLDVEDQLNTQTAIITAGTRLALRNKFDAKFTVIQVPPMSTTLVYPLSEFLGYGLEQPVIVKYDFFNFIPKYTGEFIENQINWNDPQTTLSRNLSTFEDWYGDNGAIENSFNYILTKRIFS